MSLPFTLPCPLLIATPTKVLAGFSGFFASIYRELVFWGSKKGRGLCGRGLGGVTFVGMALASKASWGHAHKGHAPKATPTKTSSL